jgi:RNA polymerase sigma-70 factor (ECF subfamily)
MQRIKRFAVYDSNSAREPSAEQITEFERLFGQCERELQAFIYTLVPHWSDAEDVLQRARIVLWKKFDLYQTGSNFGAWAFQVARFEVSNFRRTQKSDRLCFDDALLDSLADVRTSMVEELDRRRAALEQCLRKLRASDRQIIRHCYGPRATTTKEAAAQLHRPVNTLYKALNRIRRTLTECVQQKSMDDSKDEL